MTKRYTLLLSLLVALFSLPALAQDTRPAAQPALDELLAAVGQKRSAAPVADLVAKYNCKDVGKDGEGTLFGPGGAYTLIYRRGQVVWLSLTLVPKAKGDIFTGSLPGGISRDDDADKVITRLGDPQINTRDDKGDGNLIWTDVIRNREIIVRFGGGRMIEVMIRFADTARPD